MPFPSPIVAVLAHFRPLFTAPTWRKLMVLLTGTLLAHGSGTVVGALRHIGNEMEMHFSNFHQVLNRARWSPLAVSQQLLSLIIQTFVQTGGPVDLVIDETLERRWGAKISKCGHYRDSALSSRKQSVRSPGLRWIVMAVVVTLPWTSQQWALPFFCVLATTPEVSQRLGKRHKTVGMWAIKERLWCWLRDEMISYDPCMSIVDSVPVPICRFARAPWCIPFRGQASYGKDHADRQTFYGFRLHAQLSWPGLLTRLFLAPANESDGEIAPILLEGTTGVVLGDRNYWLPDLQAFLRTKSIVLQAPFRKAHSPQAAAYQSPVLGWVRYLIDTVFGQLTDRGPLKRVWARDLWHLRNRRLAMDFDAHDLLFLQSARTGSFASI